MEVVIPNLQEGYLALIDMVIKGGRIVSPRGMKTYEIEDMQIRLMDPHSSTPVRLGRKMSMKILAAEGLQWISGVSDLAQLDSVSRGKFTNYSDDGIRLYGAYGPRTYDGLRRAVKVLSEDSSSRQAVVPVWRPVEALKTRDLPCTLSWSFRIRDDGLHMTSTMRSNDVWTGVAYDVPIMCRIGSLMAWSLGVPFSQYVHQAQSFHIYDRDMEQATALKAGDDKLKEPPFFEDGLTDYVEDRYDGEDDKLTSIELWDLATGMAHDAARNRTHRYGYARGLDWYREQLRDTDKHEHFCELCRYYLPQPELLCPSNGA